MTYEHAQYPIVSYFVVDREELRQSSVREVSLGLYWTGKPPQTTARNQTLAKGARGALEQTTSSTGREQAFSLRIGELKVTRNLSCVKPFSRYSSLTT